MRGKNRTKIIAILLCCSFLAEQLFIPVRSRASTSYEYAGEADQTVVDGVTYRYRRSIYNHEEIQITAIHVPEGITKLVLPSEIDGKSVTLLHLRQVDGAEKLFHVKSVTLPKNMIFEGYDMNPTCGPVDSDLRGYFLEPSLNSYFTGLEEVLVDPANTTMVAEDGVLFNKEMTEQYFYPHEKKNEEYKEPDTIIRNYGNYNGRKYLKKLSYSSNKKYRYTTSCNETNIEKVIMPTNITYIWDNSFKNCKKLKTIQFPANLEFVGKNAFQGCSGLRNIKLPKNLRVIYAYAFRGTSIKKVTIPESVTGMGEKAFNDGTKVIKPSYLKTKKAKYTDPAYYKNSYYVYQAMVTLKALKSKKKKCYPVDDVSDMWILQDVIKVQKGKTTTLETRGEIHLYAEKYKTGIIMPDILKYRSSKPKVVKVSKKGKIKGLKKGSAVIYVTLRTGSKYNYYLRKSEIKVKVKVTKS